MLEGHAGPAENLGHLGFTQARAVVFEREQVVGFVHAEAAEAVGVGELGHAAEFVQAEGRAKGVGDFEKCHRGIIAIWEGGEREVRIDGGGAQGYYTLGGYMREKRAKPGSHSGAAPGCGCAGQAGGRKAVAVDARIKKANVHRLRRIEGQVRGLWKMVEAERYCADILVQVAAVQKALRAVSRELMRNHLRHCATQAIRQGSGAEAEAMYDELVELMDRHGR